ncbi:hypothetical protein BCR33DRAFT_851968 [Rhizoclosmatium globosum]|uniref:Cyclic nucleotide-binding domain-containing protein n=1 Tax=Rhizoclosmatium globosum TaxID=329046 RepID=A0A1Y2C4L6_9FUNG|nr:hypothetical protein BCR33DRAFT_851968 [Rhizoclosmatium globosum]|eukprot:ORY41959.1 hypothetical protein BCR33DRAFT_851968 [Rhizoclosmatium globosum]
MTDNLNLHTVLLRSIVELKSEMNSKADKLIALLQQSVSPSSNPHPLSDKMSNPSMKSIHLEFGLRWDVEDYTTPAEVNNSVPQPLFNVKAGKSANISTLSMSRRRSAGTPEAQIPDFLARAKSPFQRRRQTADATTIDSTFVPPIPERMDTSQIRPLLQPNSTGGLNVSQQDAARPASLGRATKTIEAIHSGSLKRNHDLPAKRGSFSLDRKGTMKNFETLVNHEEGNVFPKNQTISDPQDLHARRASVTEVLPKSGPSNLTPADTRIELSSTTSLEANASTDSFQSQDMRDFIQEIHARTVGVPPNDDFDKTQLDSTSRRESDASNVTDVASPHGTLERSKLRSNTIKKTEVTRRQHLRRLPTVASATAPTVNSENILEVSPPTTFLEWFFDYFSYYCLIPAYDSKGKRITWDQFDASDFNEISFLRNGLHPKSIVITYFDVITVLANIICLAEVPFIIGFNSVLPDSYGEYFSVIITIVFSIESLVAISTPNSQIGKTTIYSIREYESLRPFLALWIREWLWSYLFIDLVSIIPFSTIVGSDIVWLRLLRLLRILRLGQIMARCAIFTRVKLYVEERIGVVSAKILPIGIGIIVFLHYNACAIFYAGQLHGFLGWSQFWGQTQSVTVWDSYLWCFLLAVGNLFPMSYKPQTKMEQLFAILFIFVGAGVYAVLVGYISSAAISVDNSGRLYNQKMEELKEYITWRQLSNETKDKLISYYETKYRGKYFEEDTLLGDMNEALRTEIALHNTVDLIKKVPFLRRTVGDGRDEIFYARIASCLHIRYYIAGDCVTKEGDSGADMFFILSGKLDIVIGGEVYRSLYDGAYFGEVALINKVLRTATVQAKMPSVLYRLTYQDFHAVINEFSDIKARVMDLSQERERILMQVAAMATEKRSGTLIHESNLK